MEKLLETMIGKEIEITCGNSTGFRGEATGLTLGTISLRDKDGKTVHIAVDAVIAVNEVNDEHARPGFVG